LRSQIADRRLQIGCRLRIIGVAVLAAAVWGAACGVRQERSIADEFFAESRLRDKTALQQIATVTFEPHINGIVERFEITKVSPEEDNTKSVTISAQVRLPAGAIVRKTIVLVMTHRAGDGPTDDPDRRSRWLITGFMDAAAPPATPRS
jgi:hypothetical protein